MKLVLAVGALVAASLLAAGSSWSSPAATAPQGLHAFVYRAGEPVPAGHTYTQLPAFAWRAVRGAGSYELQLATNRSFNDGSTLVDRRGLRAPVASIQLQVPWMTGRPYALWVRVRATVSGRVSAWSAAFGFNTAWQQVPRQLSAPVGLLRWTPVDGATAYEVWFPDLGVRYRTLTNVGDEREYWTFHPQRAATIHWRVRAVRYVAKGALPDKIQVTTFGPYSPVYTTTNATALSQAAIGGVDAVSNVSSTPARPAANALMPGFAWTGSTGIDGESGNGLFRVYVYSDRGCVNSVTVGSVVGGPAWAPRAAPPLELPGTPAELAAMTAGKILGYAPQASATMADGTTVVSSEEAFGAASAATGTSTGTAAGAPDPSLTAPAGTIALPDNGWPAGRYWWTVVPVALFQDATGFVYRDLEQPQDACAAGRVWPFGMRSTPVLTSDRSPLASGIAGVRVVSAATKRPAFDELPVIAWVPALGAQSYEIQLSRHLYPWVAAVRLVSVVPSVALPLTKADRGVWYYRVRGINGNLPGTADKLTWSQPAALRITGDRFVVVQ